MRKLIYLGAILGLVMPRASGGDVTLSSLVDELTDLERLAAFPDPAYTIRQTSSYDRASRSAADVGTWFANADRGHYLRVETRNGRKEYVMLDAEGPGAVVRIWSANPGGVLRIYIDGAVEPALEAPMGDLLRGKVEPFAAPLAYEASRGCNIYFPFPYARHCKITSDQGDFYYHVNYRTYAEGTRVESYSARILAAVAPAVRRVARGLEDPASTVSAAADDRRIELELGAAGAATARTTFTARSGGEAIRLLVLRPNVQDAEALRRTVLTATFDGVETVRSPLGDFFGTGPGLNAYESLPLSVAADGTLTCRWTMPFRQSVTLSLEGHGEKSVQVTGFALLRPFRWTDDSLLFHARWRAGHSMRTEPPRDWNYVTVEGRGVYAGNVLNVANPVRAWWGEGDEKIYVDGEKFPSFFGTGTEDYYGYAWCCPEPFTRAFHNQTRCDGPGNFGYTSVNRWHVIDSIPFTREFRFDMEVWHWNRKIEVSYDSVSYWYARPGSRDNIEPPKEEDLIIPAIPVRKTRVVKGAIEGESMEIVEHTGGEVEKQDMTSFEALWSRDQHLWWRHARPGDRLVLAFPAPAAGSYRIVAHMTKAVDYGILQISVNGKKAGDPIDFFNDGVIPFEKDLGVFELAKGTNRLEIRITGSNPRARPRNHMFGLDCIVLEPVAGGSAPGE